MTETYITFYGKKYKYERSTHLKKDAEKIAKGCERDSNKKAIVRPGKNSSNEKVWDVFWRRR